LWVYDGAAPAVRFYWRGDATDIIVLPGFDPGDTIEARQVRSVLAAAFRRLRDKPARPAPRAWLILSHIDDEDERALRDILEGLHATVSEEVGRFPDVYWGALAWRIDGAPRAP
jgi:hypothetical protein